jgi:hypothetical protein
MFVTSHLGAPRRTSHPAPRTSHLNLNLNLNLNLAPRRTSEISIAVIRLLHFPSSIS